MRDEILLAESNYTEIWIILDDKLTMDIPWETINTNKPQL